MNELEALGRLHLEHVNLKREYAKLLEVIGWVASGEVTPDRLTVKGETWALAERATTTVAPVETVEE
jgi:hypothetical protein